MNADRIRDIIRLYKDIDHGESESLAKANELKWKLAEKIWEEWRDGTKAIDLAEAIGKSTQHIYFMRRCWEVKANFSKKPFFNDVYNSAEVQKRPPKPELDTPELDTNLTEDQLNEIKARQLGLTPAEFTKRVEIEEALEVLAYLLKLIRKLERDKNVEGVSPPLEAALEKLEKYHKPLVSVK